MSGSSHAEIILEPGALSVEELEKALDACWKQLTTTDAGKAELKSDPKLAFLLNTPQEENPFSVRQASAGFGVTEVIISIGVKIGYDVAKYLILKIIVPKVKKALGNDAVGNEKK